MKTKTLRKFKSLQELFARAARWQKGWFAATRKGVRCYSDDPNAVCFCLFGGLERVYGTGVKNQQMVNRLKQTLPDTSFVAWNDAPERTIQDIRALVKKAGV